jgi:hypothetical protein
MWNAGWNGRDYLNGRVVVGFQVPSRGDVDKLYVSWTQTGYPTEPNRPTMRSGALVTRLSKVQMG